MADPLGLIRAEIAAQSPEDRAEYALELLAYYLAPTDPFIDGCYRLGLNLPLSQIRLLNVLDRQRGAFVSLERLHGAMALDREEWPSVCTFYNAMSTMRKRLERSHLPVEIRSSRVAGYALFAPKGFTFEAAPMAGLRGVA